MSIRVLMLFLNILVNTKLVVNTKKHNYWVIWNVSSYFFEIFFKKIESVDIPTSSRWSFLFPHSWQQFFLSDMCHSHCCETKSLFKICIYLMMNSESIYFIPIIYLYVFFESLFISSLHFPRELIIHFLLTLSI